MKGRPSVYVETSVVSYLTARTSRNPDLAADQAVTRAWWARRDDYTIRTSQVAIDEAARGDRVAARERLDVLDTIPLLQPNPDFLIVSSRLAIVLGLPARARADAAHVAAATLAKVSFLLTWNCNHLANPALTRKMSVFIRDLGLSLPRIVTPTELLAEVT